MTDSPSARLERRAEQPQPPQQEQPPQPPVGTPPRRQPRAGSAPARGESVIKCQYSSRHAQ
jgi:hypothetical protein